MVPRAARSGTPRGSGETSRCGDNVVDSDEGEVCDGDTVTCSSLGFGNGDVACFANCSGYQTCPSTGKTILSFAFEAAFNEALIQDVVTIDVTAVSLVVPIGTPRANLTAFHRSAGATVKVTALCNKAASPPMISVNR